jgi:hypothetical protein
MRQQKAPELPNENQNACNNQVHAPIYHPNLSFLAMLLFDLLATIVLLCICVSGSKNIWRFVVAKMGLK